MKLVHFLFLTTAALAAPVPPGPPLEGDPEAAPLRDARFERIAVIGASMSAGFGLQSELRADVDFADVLRSLLVVEPERVEALGSSSFFFVNKEATRQVDAALAVEPSLVVGIDFLFWFAYGSNLTAEDRGVLFEAGLGFLERFEVPLLVGDLPDMHIALEGRGAFGGPLLAPGQIPAADTLARLNARLAEWSKARPNVVIVPLAEHARRLAASEPIVIRGNRWEGERERELLQPDLLHPSAEGCVAIGLLAMDALDHRSALAAGNLRWGAAGATKVLWDATSEAREKALADERRREERKRARAEERAGEKEPAGGGVR